MKSSHSKNILGTLPALLLLLANAAFAADDVKKEDAAPLPAAEAIPRHPLLNDKLRISLGGFYAGTNTTVRVDANTALGAEINFEDLLGLSDRKLVGEANLYWRFGERWRLGVDYFSINRSGSRTLTQDVTWNGQTYTVGTNVNSQSKISDLRTTVGYSVFKRPDKELGFGAGLHWTGLRFSLDASGAGTEAANVTAPLPVVYMYSNVALTDTWAMSTHLDWLSLNYDKYSGSVRAVGFDFIYQPYTHFAFGVGWHAMILGLTVDNPDSRMQARLGLQGLAANVSYSY
jgi:hypothetical protein